MTTSIKTVIVASTNPVKVKVAERAFAAVFPNEKFTFIPVKSESGVPDQPMGGETRRGAQNRLAFVKREHPKADYWISQEGGLFEEGDMLCNRAWISVCDKDGCTAEASTAHFYLPTQVTRLVKEGMELADAHDKFSKSVNSGQGMGAISHLTDGAISRADYYLHAAIIALSQLKHRAWYL